MRVNPYGGGLAMADDLAAHVGDGLFHVRMQASGAMLGPRRTHQLVKPLAERYDPPFSLAKHVQRTRIPARANALPTQGKQLHAHAQTIGRQGNLGKGDKWIPVNGFRQSRRFGRNIESMGRGNPRALDTKGMAARTTQPHGVPIGNDIYLVAIEEKGLDRSLRTRLA